MATKVEYELQATLKELADKVGTLETKVSSLEKEVRVLKATPKAVDDSSGLKDELARVARLVDRIVQVIRSPTERITDRNLKL